MRLAAHEWLEIRLEIDLCPALGMTKLLIQQKETPMELSTLLPLIGIPIVVAGFALRFNPLLVVTVAGLATGLAVGMDIGALLESFGEKFVNSRSLAIFVLILPVVGLLERYGLKERAQNWISGIASAT